MNNPDLSRWQRFVNYCAPYYRLWQREKRRHATTRDDLASHAAHFQLACDQRDSALAEARDATAYAMGVRARCRKLEEQLAFISRTVTTEMEPEG